MRVFLSLAIALFLSGCGAARYYWHLGAGQLEILLSKRSLQQSIQDKSLSTENRRKLALVPIIKDFGVREIGLSGSRSYETFVDLQRSFTTLVLSAAPPDSLNLFRWSFPVVGKMAYKGFFDEALADTERERFAALGYDVYLRSASAFSTLGWFDDPIYSPMLRSDESGLANTVLHEMAHETVYFADHTEFNESLAMFIGNQATLVYLAARYGPASTQVTAAMYAFDDQQRFAAFIRDTLAGLDEIYARPLGRTEKIEAKTTYIEARKREFRKEALSKFHFPHYYQGFPDRVWNNASLLARDAYYGDIASFSKLFAERGESLSDFIRYLQTWADDFDPRLRLRQESGDLPG